MAVSSVRLARSIQIGKSCWSAPPSPERITSNKSGTFAAKLVVLSMEPLGPTSTDLPPANWIVFG